MLASASIGQAPEDVVVGDRTLDPIAAAFSGPGSGAV
jgi:hypothetical protein